MAKDRFITRYARIIQRLEKGPASFADIQAYLAKSFLLPDEEATISIRTLQRDIQDIREQFGIEIVNERRGDKRYFIKTAHEHSETGSRLLEAYQMLQALRFSEPFRNVLLFDNRKPLGLEQLSGLMYACAHKKIVRFTYHTYWNEAYSDRLVHPLALKEALGRWYLVAVDSKDGQVKTFGLDRISDTDISKTSYRQVYRVDVADIFRHTLGVFNSQQQKPAKIILSVEPNQAHYLEAYPLHSSQQITSSNQDTVTMELTLFITEDLIMEILKMGKKVKVMSPAALRNRIKKEAEEMLKMYS